MAKWKVILSRKRVLNLLLVALFLCFALMFANALREIVPQMEEYRAAQREYQEIRAIARVPIAPEAQHQAQEAVYAEYGIDWAVLQEINPNIGGDKTISRRGYRFWFDFSNEDGTPTIRYTRYTFS